MTSDNVLRVEGSVTVEAPVERVWELATNPMLSSHWNSSITEVREFSGLPIEVGSNWVQVVRIAGLNTPMPAQVTACDPPNSGTVQLTGPGNPRVTTVLTRDDRRTILCQVMELSVGGGFGGMAIRLARPTIERELKQALLRQKEAAETGSSV